VLLIAYPFVMALWYSLTSIRVGDAGTFVGWLIFRRRSTTASSGPRFRNTVFYTFWATLFSSCSACTSRCC